MGIGRNREETETVIQFKVSLNWDQWHTAGVNAVDVTVEGCSTSSEAIDKAITMVKPLREDTPKRVSASVEEWQRQIPRKIGASSTPAEDDES